MTEPNSGNGNKQLIAVQEVKIDQLLQNQIETKELLERYFGAEGVCYKARTEATKERTNNANEISNIKTHLKGLWTITTFIIVCLVGVFVDILKGALGK